MDLQLNSSDNLELLPVKYRLWFSKMIHSYTSMSDAYNGNDIDNGSSSPLLLSSAVDPYSSKLKALRNQTKSLIHQLIIMKTGFSIEDQAVEDSRQSQEYLKTLQLGRSASTSPSRGRARERGEVQPIG